MGDTAIEQQGGETGGKKNKTTVDREQYTVLYSNARSILNKIDQLRVTVLDQKPSFILICESFVREEISDGYLSIDGYQLVVRQHGRDTVQGKCRGLLIYVRDGIHATQIVDQQFDNVIEMAGVSIPWGNGEVSH